MHNSSNTIGEQFKYDGPHSVPACCNRCLRGMAPEYLSELLCSHPASSSRHCLRSVNRNQLALPLVRLSMYGGRRFCVSGAQPFGTVCRIISGTLLHLLTFLALSKELLISTVLTFSDPIAHKRDYVTLFALYKFLLSITLCTLLFTFVV